MTPYHTPVFMGVCGLFPGLKQIDTPDFENKIWRYCLTDRNLARCLRFGMLSVMFRQTVVSRTELDIMRKTVADIECELYDYDNFDK